MFACDSRQQQALNTLSSIANQTANLPLAMRFFRKFARLSPRLALRVINLESVWEELVDGVFYTEIWSANGIVMLYLSNGSRDQKQAKVLLLPKSLSMMVWWTRDHVKSVSCHGDVKNVESLGYSKSNNPLELLFSLKWWQPGNISSYSFPRML